MQEAIWPIMPVLHHHHIKYIHQALDSVSSGGGVGMRKVWQAQELECYKFKYNQYYKTRMFIMTFNFPMYTWHGVCLLTPAGEYG